MVLSEPTTIHQRLANLKFRLEQVTRSWTVDDYVALLKFYVAILPKVMDAERCTIFIADLEIDKIWSMFGTGLDGIKIEPPRDESVVGRAMSTGQCIIEHDLDKRRGFHTEVDARTGFVTHSLICVPIKSLTGRGAAGAVEVLNKMGGKRFTSEDEVQLQEVAHFLSASIESILLSREILRISNQLNCEVERFEKNYFRDIPFIVESPIMRAILDDVRMVSKTPVNVFIHGEHGTGKELIARMIHEGSDRRDKPFVAVNCASILESLMESEFFGYEKGAFTGAVSSHKGRFEEADGGTLFLDEVADMPPAIQPKFLRAIQEGEGCRLGSNRVNRYNLRIISSTNKDLRQEVTQGRFREDLFFRLFSVEIHIPPLRERREDIITMALAFLDKVSHRFNKRVAGFSPEVLRLLEDYSWPGNVRQLLREVEHLVALTPEGERIVIDTCSRELQNFHLDLKEKGIVDHSIPDQVKALEIKLIRKALKEAEGNKNKAAALLGITRQGLHKKLKRYNLEEGDKRSPY
ncbi:MAG: sigma 54-interacting transcriptional regulator [bacterium]